MSVTRLTAPRIRVTSLEYLIKVLDSYGKLIMGLKAVYALVAFVYFCDRIFNFFFSKDNKLLGMSVLSCCISVTGGSL